MAKILLIIALIVMAATAALGFMAKGNIDKLQSTLSTTKGTLETTKTNLVTMTKDRDKNKEDLTAATAQIVEKDKEIATQKGQMDDINNKLKVATTDLEAKIKEVTEANEKLAKLMSTTPGGPAVNPEELAKKIEELTGNLTKAQAEVAESKSLVDALTQQKKKVEDEMVVLAAYKKSREASQMRLGTQGRVLAVNGGWNFVVLSIGDKQGAVMNATMLVVRGGEPIAKVRISSVEPSTSIADILPGSVRRGVTVQPGDNVVYEGRGTATTMPSAAPAPGAVPALPVR